MLLESNGKHCSPFTIAFLGRRFPTLGLAAASNELTVTPIHESHFLLMDDMLDYPLVYENWAKKRLLETQVSG